MPIKPNTRKPNWTIDVDGTRMLDMYAESIGEVEAAARTFVRWDLERREAPSPASVVVTSLKTGETTTFAVVRHGK